MPVISHFDNLYDGALSESIIRRGIDMLCTGVTSPAAAAAATAGEAGDQAGIDRTYAACVVAWVAELLKGAPLGSVAELAGTSILHDEEDNMGDGDDDDDDNEEAKDLTIKNVLRTCLLSRSLQCVLW